MRSSCYASEITGRPRITGLSVTPAWCQLGQALSERIVADRRRIGRAHITVLRQPVSPAAGAPNRPVMASAEARGGFACHPLVRRTLRDYFFTGIRMGGYV